MKLRFYFKFIFTLLPLFNISIAVKTLPESKETSTAKPTVRESDVNVRVVTDRDIILGREGVPIEYWYNETSTEQEYKSSPGCPQSVDGYPWVYYGAPPKCFLTSFTGPCELGQSITLQSGSLYGTCACECFTETVEYRLLLPDTPQRYLQCSDTHLPGFSLIFDKEGGECHHVGSKGPCDDGKIVAKFTNNSLTCLPPCYESDANWRKLEEKGICAELKVPTRSSAVFVLAGSCPSDKKYSYLLEKCIKPTSIRRRTLG